MHAVGQIDPTQFVEPGRFSGHSVGFERLTLIDQRSGSVHMSLYLNHLHPGGAIDSHAQMYEESFYLLDGDVNFQIEGKKHRLTAGDYGHVRVGERHGWENSGSQPVRWLEMTSPQPKGLDRERDVFFAPQSGPNRTGQASQENSNKSKHQHPYLGHFHVSDIPPFPEGRIADGPLEGVLFEMLVDDKLGADHQRLFLIEYQPTIGIGLHDHPFEEGYLILEGEVEAVADGQTYRLGPGDHIWTGVGCMHSFKNRFDKPVIWLETQAPAPPARNGFRFVAAWEAVQQEIEG